MRTGLKAVYYGSCLALGLGAGALAEQSFNQDAEVQADDITACISTLAVSEAIDQRIADCLADAAPGSPAGLLDANKPVANARWYADTLRRNADDMSGTVIGLGGFIGVAAGAAIHLLVRSGYHEAAGDLAGDLPGLLS